MNDDRELVARIARGEHQAFELLYARHRTRLYRHALVQTGGRPAIAEEIVQEVFLSLFAGSSAPTRNVGAYLLRAVRNRALNACARREDRGERADPELLCRTVEAELPGPEEAAHRREEARILAEALLELPPEQREVVLLRTFEGLPWKKVAALVGAPLPTASSRYRAALDGLRRSCRSLFYV